MRVMPRIKGVQSKGSKMHDERFHKGSRMCKTGAQKCMRGFKRDEECAKQGLKNV